MTVADVESMSHDDLNAAIERGLYGNDPAKRWREFSRQWDLMEMLLDRTTNTTKEHWTLELFSSGAIATFRYEGGRDLPYVPGEYRSEADELPRAVAQTVLMATQGITA